MREQNWLKTREKHETVVKSVWDWQFGKFFASPTKFLFFSSGRSRLESSLLITGSTSPSPLLFPHTKPNFINFINAQRPPICPIN